MVWRGRYAEVVTLPARLAALGREVGQRQIIGLFDQNLCYDEGDVLGTDLIRELRREHRWEGVLMIHSANDEPDAIPSYLAAGADGCIGKAPQGGMNGILADLATAFARRTRTD